MILKCTRVGKQGLGRGEYIGWIRLGESNPEFSNNTVERLYEDVRRILRVNESVDVINGLLGWKRGFQFVEIAEGEVLDASVPKQEDTESGSENGEQLIEGEFTALFVRGCDVDSYSVVVVQGVREEDMHRIQKGMNNLPEPLGHDRRLFGGTFDLVATFRGPVIDFSQSRIPLDSENPKCGAHKGNSFTPGDMRFVGVYTLQELDSILGH